MQPVVPRYSPTQGGPWTCLIDHGSGRLGVSSPVCQSACSTNPKVPSIAAGLATVTPTERCICGVEQPGWIFSRLSVDSPPQAKHKHQPAHSPHPGCSARHIPYGFPPLSPPSFHGGESKERNRAWIHYVGVTRLVPIVYQRAGTRCGIPACVPLTFRLTKFV